METLKFKTNIKCGGCIATVTPHLDALQGVEQWEVDTNGADKVLTIKGEDGSLPEKVVSALEKAGFKAELI
jgi:copper chaperone